VKEEEEAKEEEESYRYCQRKANLEGTLKCTKIRVREGKLGVERECWGERLAGHLARLPKVIRVPAATKLWATLPLSSPRHGPEPQLLGCCRQLVTLVLTKGHSSSEEHNAS
jgi:hypothetical protein